MYNNIIDDKLDFVNNLMKIINTAIRTKKINQIKDDILKTINNIVVGDIKDNSQKNKSEVQLFKNEIVDQLNLIGKVRVDYLTNVNEILMLMNKLYDEYNTDDVYTNTTLLKLNKINALLDKSLDYAWQVCGAKKIKHKIINDKDMYLDRYINIINDKLDLVNHIGGLIDSYVLDACNIVDGINKCHDNNSLYDILEEDFKKFKDNVLKLISNFNVCDKADTKKKDSKRKDSESDTKKKDTKNNTKPDTKNKTERGTKNNTRPDIKNNTKPDTNDDTRASIKNKQKSIKSRYKSLLKTKKTIKNNIDLIYSALKKLPNESQSKLIELVRLDTILNDSINVVWREIHEGVKKGIKKIDINKIKNVDSFIFQLRAIINHKILLLKTSVVVKLNIIIGDIKNKSNIGDVYNYNDKINYL